MGRLEKKLVVTLDCAGDGGSRLVFCEEKRNIMPNSRIAPLLFGTDGVRGIAGAYPLQKSLLRKLGAAAAVVFRQHIPGKSSIFLLGRDTRGSGPWMAQAFAEGALTQNVVLRDIGIVSTPSLACLVPDRKVLGGVMISASHNPAKFNGVKLFGPNGRKCPDAWEREIEQWIHESGPLQGSSLPLQEDKDALSDYLRFLRSTLPPGMSFRGLTLVVDCAHGSLSKIAPAFLKRLGARVIAIGATPNGKNINAGWGSQHPEKMQKLVMKHKADAGIAFDGDGDRAVFCDEKGRLLDGDYVVACVARCLKEGRRLTKNTVVVTVMANLGLVKTLKAWGLNVLTTPVGDRYVSDQLDECGGVLGGEQSGHIIFHEYLPTGDGLLTAIQMLSMLRQRKRPFSWAYTLFDKYPQLLMNVEVKNKKPLDECQDVQRTIHTARETLADQGRVVVRYSGTEPLLRIMMEGPDKTQLQHLANAIAEQAVLVLGKA